MRTKKELTSRKVKVSFIYRNVKYVTDTTAEVDAYNKLLIGKPTIDLKLRLFNKLTEKGLSFSEDVNKNPSDICNLIGSLDVAIIV